MDTPVSSSRSPYRTLLFSCTVLVLSMLPLYVYSTSPGEAPKKPNIPEKISILVRDFDTDAVVQNVQIKIFKDGEVLHADQTNDMGYAEIDISKKTKKHWKASCVELSYHYGTGENRKGDTITLNTFISHYELYTKPTYHPAYDPSTLTADVHLQTSLRVHNLFAKELFINNQEAPLNLNWYNNYNRRSTLHKDRWYEVRLQHFHDTRLLQDRRRMMYQMLCGTPTSCKGDNNRLTDYTQATYPHLKVGRVALSFNPITPIEKSVANSWFRRHVNSAVTGLKVRWLREINGNLSHWDNFKKEYALLMSLSRTYNHFPVRFYTSGMDLDTNITTIVNCAEGGHLLHGPLMARKIDLITSPSRSASRKIIRQHIDMLDSLAMSEFHNLFAYFVQQSSEPYEYVPSGDPGEMKTVINRAPEEITNPLTDSLVNKEVLDNVRQFKDTSLFHIWLLNIAHHTYNHLFGHAVAFDQGGLIGGFLAKLMHGSHTSEEHYDTWRKMYYNITGPNELGKKVMDALITRNEQGHRILIDLKHSGYATRKWFFDTVLPEHLAKTGDTIPPVCSHCAANGQKEIDYSRYADEFMLRDAPFANTFYPFELNLYDEEITRIFQADGLLGIKLEQRGLGGYLNKHQLWKTGLKQSGELKNEDRPSLAKRYSYVKRWLRRYRVHDPLLVQPAVEYIQHVMGAKDLTQQIFEADYISAEPFLQNLFYFIDHSGYADPRRAWGQLSIGSDLDGIINAIDICPTSSHYPQFKKRLKQFIPIFLQMRSDMYPDVAYRSYEDYFSNEEELDHALTQLFYLSAKNFVEKYFIDKTIIHDDQTSHAGDHYSLEPVIRRPIY